MLLSGHSVLCSICLFESLTRFNAGIIRSCCMMYVRHVAFVGRVFGASYLVSEHLRTKKAENIKFLFI